MDWNQYKVSVPVGVSGRAKVERFTVPESSLENLRIAMSGRLPCPPGEWTRIMEGGTLWMSDTPAEVVDHRGAMREIARRGGRVAINGLGIGVVLQAALKSLAVDEVDVVERSADVIALVGPHYAAMAEDEGKRLTIHEADALTMRWPRGTHFSAVWHDIWPNITSDNLPTMGTLHRKYARITDWQDSWCRYECKRIQRQNRSTPWY